MATKLEFYKNDNSVLTEIERRIRYFKKKLDDNLIVILLPSEAKRLKEKGYIKPTDKEIPRAVNWYKLTDKGIGFFNRVNRINYAISDRENELMFEGKICYDYNYYINLIQDNKFS